MTGNLPPLPIGDRFKDTNLFRVLGTGSGDRLLECWESGVQAYARAAIEDARVSRDVPAVPPFWSKRNAALALYQPPFRFEHGYIYDANGKMCADEGAMPEHVAARVRGWGRIGYMPDAAALQDEVGQVIAEALTAFWLAASPQPQPVQSSQYGSPELQSLILEKLAQPVQAQPSEQAAQPVAQWQKMHPLRTNGRWENTDEFDAKWWRDNSQGWEIRPLFTAPPKAVPLTDEQIDKAAKVLSHCMDYPWEHMPEDGRLNMRKNARTVIEAAINTPATVEKGASDAN